MNLKQIKPIFILFAIIFFLYGCEKENDDFSKNLDTTYFVETFLYQFFNPKGVLAAITAVSTYTESGVNFLKYSI